MVTTDASQVRVDVHLTPDTLASALAADVRDGLSATPKELPPKWFYDDRGSELFDEITRLPEYYPTRTERSILIAHARDIAELTKADIREASRALGLRTWDRPASPCLSSRFPYGTRITAERLRQVAAAERWLHEQGLRELRVRFHEALARVEVPPADMPAVLALRTELVAAFRALGFTWVALDLQGFRSGSLNEALVSRTNEGPGDEPPAPRLR